MVVTWEELCKKIDVPVDAAEVMAYIDDISDEWTAADARVDKARAERRATVETYELEIADLRKRLKKSGGGSLDAYREEVRTLREKLGDTRQNKENAEGLLHIAREHLKEKDDKIADLETNYSAAMKELAETIINLQNTKKALDATKKTVNSLSEMDQKNLHEIRRLKIKIQSAAKSNAVVITELQSANRMLEGYKDNTNEG